MVTLTIDGHEVTVPEGTNLIEAARTLDIAIPHYCYHQDIGVDGNCRICLVEVNGNTDKLAISCKQPCGEGMDVKTESEAVVPPIRRSEIPVRATIHSSLVSRVFSRSWLVTTFSGRAVPQPEMTAPVAPGRVAGMSETSCGARCGLVDHEVRSQAMGCRGATRSVSAAM